ncbi:SAM-dependent methyltransferase [Fredinandcohnia humi]
MTVKAIGYVKSQRTEIKDDYWGGVRSTISLDKDQFDEDVTKGLESFSHIEVLYYFHRVDSSRIETKARRPRNNPNWPEVGIFAQRAKGRPNLIGVTCCRLLGVDGLTLTVEGLDAIDSTPVLDIKPYMKEFGPREEVVQPVWTTELMKDYFLE